MADGFAGPRSARFSPRQRVAQSRKSRLAFKEVALGSRTKSLESLFRAGFNVEPGERFSAGGPYEDPGVFLEETFQPVEGGVPLNSEGADSIRGRCKALCEAA